MCSQFYPKYVDLQKLIQMIQGIACLQRPNYAETCFGIDLENKYDIYEKRMDSNNGASKIPILTAKENSGYCARQLCSNACRAMEINIYNMTGNSE